MVTLNIWLWQCQLLKRLYSKCSELSGNLVCPDHTPAGVRKHFSLYVLHTNFSCVSNCWWSLRMWGDQCTFFLWLNEKLFCRLLPVSLHIHQVFLFCCFTFSTPYLSLNVTAIPAPYAQNVTAIPAPYAQSVLTQCAKCSCGGLEKMSPFLCTICNFSSTFTPSTLPLLDLWPQVHCSLCQRPARGVTCNIRRQMIPGVAFSC